MSKQDQDKTASTSIGEDANETLPEIDERSNSKTASERTLFTSVLLSSPGPLVLGLGLIVGRSSTQMADFLRRTAELAAIICAYVVYRMTTKDGVNDEERRARLERNGNRFIGVMMCVAGVVMAAVALTSSNTDKGNVIPALVIALLGAVVNCAFWIRYTKLNRTDPNAIIATQARLYRAKTLVDTCVSAALLTVVLAPGTSAAAMVDIAGSILVSAYMMYCGAKTVHDSQ